MVLWDLPWLTRKMNVKTLSSLVLLTMVVSLVACNAPAQLSRPDATPRVLIMSPLGIELEQLRSHAQVTNTHVINGRTYSVGQLAGQDVVLVSTGMSMVNAAMVAQTALHHFDARAIVVSGIAGGVNPNLHIGDVVAPTQWAEYQEQVLARETDEGWIVVEPFTRRLGNYGMMFTQHVHVTRKSGEADVEEGIFWFPVAPELLAVARQVAPQVQLSRYTPEGTALTHDPRIIAGGNGVSGPSFVDNARYRDWVWQTFQADALDMESAAIAHVAYVNEVPYIVFRSLSDLAGGGAGENEQAMFLELAADNSAAVVEAFLEALPVP
jgi:adenosylhomocysteine nucleosidase